jgi:hypothetical protein
MNEADVLTELLESIPQGAAPPSTQAKLTEAINAELQSSSRRSLPRPRLVVVGGMAAIAAAVIAGAVALVPGSQHAGYRAQGHTSPVPARFADWTISTSRHGVLRVAVNRLRNAAGLERLLRAHGVPARVIFTHHDFQATTSRHGFARGCQTPAMSDETLAKLSEEVLPEPITHVSHVTGGLSGKVLPGVVFLVNPSRLPRGLGLYFKAAVSTDPNTGQVQVDESELDLVKASRSCTGS